MRCTVIQRKIRKYDANAMNNTHGLIKGQECGMEKDRGKKEWERGRGYDGKTSMYALMETQVSIFNAASHSRVGGALWCTQSETCLASRALAPRFLLTAESLAIS